MGSANEWRRYICNVVSHWLCPYPEWSLNIKTVPPLHCSSHCDDTAPPQMSKHPLVKPIFPLPSVFMWCHLVFMTSDVIVYQWRHPRGHQWYLIHNALGKDRRTRNISSENNTTDYHGIKKYDYPYLPTCGKPHRNWLANVWFQIS